MTPRWSATVLAATLVLAGCVAPQLGEPGNPSEAETPPEDRGHTGTEASPIRWADVDQAVIRPGVEIADRRCTANFVFRSPDNASIYIGSAAHCFDSPFNETNYEINDTVSIAGGRADGRLAWMGDRGPNWSDNESLDFALVEIASEHIDETHPGMMGYGGPSGLASSIAVGDTVRTYGNSTFRYGTERLNARNGTVTDARWEDGDVRALFRPPSVPGDSGSPVVTASGQAVGTLTTGDVLHTPVPPGTDDLPSAGTNGIGWLPWSLKHVRETSDLEPILVTAPGGGDP